MKNFRAAFLFIGILAGCLLAETTGIAAAKQNDMLVYFGTFTKSGSKGIYVSRLDLSSGKLSQPELAAEIGACGFLAIHPNKQFLYSVGDLKTKGDKPAGGVNAFSIDPQSGKLTFINQQSSGGPGPAHLSVDHTGKSVLVANYGGGSVAALPIQNDGQLGELTTFIQHSGSSVNPSRQKEPHAHIIQVSPEWRLVKSLLRWFLGPLPRPFNHHFLPWFCKQAKVLGSPFDGARFGAFRTVEQLIIGDAFIEKSPQFTRCLRLRFGVFK